MKAYFERVYQKGNILYCMTTLEAFENHRGVVEPETYFIHSCMVLSNGEVTDWEIKKSYVNKTQAVKAFEKMIK